ncbi:hypothetical protein AVEN_170907-1, partial [Araneus ventricosus]
MRDAAVARAINGHGPTPPIGSAYYHCRG